MSRRRHILSRAVAAAFIALALICLLPATPASPSKTVDSTAPSRAGSESSDRLPLSEALKACFAHQASEDSHAYQRCLDRRVAVLRAAFLSSDAVTTAMATGLPTPPRSLGVHTSCHKFGRVCPAEYVTFLESHLTTSQREVMARAEDTESTRTTDDTAHGPHTPTASPSAATDTIEMLTPSSDALPIPFTFNASQSYVDWAHLTNLYAHMIVLQRRLRKIQGSSAAATESLDTLTPTRVRLWQQTLRSAREHLDALPSPSPMPTSSIFSGKRSWQCWARYTVPSRIAQSAVWTWQQWHVTDYADDDNMNDNAGESAPAVHHLTRVSFALARAARGCLVWSAGLLWPRWTWLWWVRKLVLLLQLWCLVDALTGAPLNDAVVKDILELPLPIRVPPPRAPSPSSEQEAPTPQTALPTASALTSMPTTRSAASSGSIPIIATTIDGVPEQALEELTRYYSLVDLHLAQHVPLILVKFRRALCVSLLCQFALLMVSFVEQCTSWVQPSATTSPPTHRTGSSTKSLLTPALSWISPWHAVRSAVGASSGMTSLLWLLAPTLIGLRTLVAAAKGLVEANGQLAAFRVRTLHDQVEMLRPA